ncbi:hypothetical protein BYT27DRAFT_7081851 [Phlegmacium glaucopus]|nr:hypothetical protein BYT27DRAFT_7081851 [Phlegmacium glaucopus]
MPGGLSKDTLICIALLSALSDGHDHLRAIIQRDLQNATIDRPFLPHHIASYIASDTQLLLGDASRANAPSGSSTIALTARPASKAQEPVICSNCGKEHHTDPYCILPGGGMAGKTIEESRAARRRDRGGKTVGKVKNTSNPVMKHKVRITTATGQALIVEVDDDTLANGTSAAPPNDFAGVTHTTDDLEWDGFAHMALIERGEEEIHINSAATPEPELTSSINLTTSVDWNKASQPIDLAKVTVAALNQNSKTILSLAKFPFYVDSGASIYVTPDKSDFYTLEQCDWTRDINR